MDTTEKLDKCIAEYRELSISDCYTPQRRGQLFNDLIKSTLNAHNVWAVSNHISIGEIDVCFKVNEKRILLEAKWEKNKTSIDPIAKLGLRISQRMPNNYGIVLSMSGFTTDAIKQIEGPGRPNIICIGKDVFESIVLGIIDAEDLFEACIDAASFQGKFYLQLGDILKYLPRKEIRSYVDIKNLSTGLNLNNELIDSLKPIGNISCFEILYSGLPFGQNGISICKKNIYLTLIDGIYEVSKSLNKLIDVDCPQNRVIFEPVTKQIFFIKNGSVLSQDSSGVVLPRLQRYPGHVRLFEFNGSVNILSNGNNFTKPKIPVKIVKDILGEGIELTFDYPASECVDACLTSSDNTAIIGSGGLTFYTNTTKIWNKQVVNGASVTYYNEYIYYLERGTKLFRIDESGENVEKLCEFDVMGSVGDFDIIDEKQFIFHLFYDLGNHRHRSYVVNVNLG